MIISPIRDDAGELLGFVRVGRDLTEQREQEQLVQRQRDEILELSTPVIQVWDKVLVLPVIGTLDSARAARLTESLLERIAADQAEVVILDVSGVPAIDTDVAQHLLKTVEAARLMGTDEHPQRRPAGDRAGHRPPRHRPGQPAQPHQPQGRPAAGAGLVGAAPIGPGGGRCVTRCRSCGWATTCSSRCRATWTTRTVEQIEQEVTREVARTQANGALIDVSGLAVVDSFVARVLARLVAMIRLLGRGGHDRRHPAGRGDHAGRAGRAAWDTSTPRSTPNRAWPGCVDDAMSRHTDVDDAPDAVAPTRIVPSRRSPTCCGSARRCGPRPRTPGWA